VYQIGSTEISSTFYSNRASFNYFCRPKLPLVSAHVKNSVWPGPKSTKSPKLLSYQLDFYVVMQMTKVTVKRAIFRKTKNRALSLIYQQGGFRGTHPDNHLKEYRISDPLQHYVCAKCKEIRVPIHALWEKWMLVVVTQTKHFYSRRVGVISTSCKSNCLQ